MLTPSEASAAPAEQEAQAEELAALRAKVQELEKQIAWQNQMRQNLKWKLQDLVRRLYGPKSEKIDPKQLSLAPCVTLLVARIEM